MAAATAAAAALASIGGVAQHPAHSPFEFATGAAQLRAPYSTKPFVTAWRISAAPLSNPIFSINRALWVC